jgi:hypothetical protein
MGVDIGTQFHWTLSISSGEVTCRETEGISGIRFHLEKLCREHDTETYLKFGDAYIKLLSSGCVDYTATTQVSTINIL